MVIRNYWFRVGCQDIVEILERRAKRAPWIIKQIRVSPEGYIRIDATIDTHNKIESYLDEVVSEEYTISEPN